MSSHKTWILVSKEQQATQSNESYSSYNFQWWIWWLLESLYIQY